MSAAEPVHFILPGPLETPTGGFLYDRRIIEELRARGVTVAVHELAGRYPTPDEAARRAAGVCFSCLPDEALTVVDGLAGGALPEVMESAAKRLRLVALVHHPLCKETGLTEENIEWFKKSEARALAAARRVVATSETTAETLRRIFAVPSRAIDAVPPGADPAPLADKPPGDECRLLCVATLIPRKGHDVLLNALEQLPDAGWRLTCVGSNALDPAHARRIYALARNHRHAGRISFTGAIDRSALTDHYLGADLLVLPSFYEGFGLVVTEAIAHGVPVLATTGGAVPRTLPEGAGLLVPPGDARALGEALRGLVASPATLARLRAGARRARSALPGWDESARLFQRALEKVPR